MNRPLKLSVMLALAVGSAHVAAQSLGQVQMKSALGQPLVAEIPLISEGAGDTGRIEVSLASEAAYSQAGINRTGLPADLQLAVATNGQGQKVIRITSGVPVNDTYLDILVELHSGRSSAVREVTMLLDPPAAMAIAPAASSTPKSVNDTRATESYASDAAPAPAPPRPASAPRTRIAAEPVSRSARKAPASGAGTYGPVQRGQTLMEIARKESSGDVNQMLLALQKANPDAFYRDNVNALKTGAVLRRPSSEDLQAQSAAAALAEIKRQNEEWRGGAARAPAVVADAAVVERSSQSTAKSTAKSDRLELVPAKAGGESASTRAGVAGGKGNVSLADLRQELDSQKETLSALKQQGDELKSRISDLEDINQKNQRLLSLKDSEIAELQHKLAEAQKAAAVAPAAPAVAIAPTATSVAANPVATPPVNSAVTPATPATPAAPAAIKPAAAKPVAAHPPIVAQQVDEPWYTQPWAWAAGAGGVLVLALLALANRRNKPAVPKERVTPSLADQFGDNSPVDRSEQEHEHEFGTDHEMDADQRELLDELAEHPDNVDLHLELVSLYHSRRDVEHFEAAAEAMYAYIGEGQQDEWQDVVHMGEDLAPNHPLFRHETAQQQASRAGAEEAFGAPEEFDLGSYATDLDHHVIDEPGAPPPLPAQPEYHFNFDLTPEYADVVEPRVILDSEPVSSRREKAVDHSPVFANEQVPALDEEGEAASVAHVTPPAPPVSEPAPTWHFDEPDFVEDEHDVDAHGGSFSDDPADTKLDLARAYLDMGDADGARAMLEEVIAEGTQMQKDVARRMLENLA